jgi:hypothetical protein
MDARGFTVGASRRADLCPFAHFVGTSTGVSDNETSGAVRRCRKADRNTKEAAQGDMCAKRYSLEPPRPYIVVLGLTTSVLPHRSWIAGGAGLLTE